MLWPPGGASVRLTQRNDFPALDRQVLPRIELSLAGRPMNRWSCQFWRRAWLARGPECHQKPPSFRPARTSTLIAGSIVLAAAGPHRQPSDSRALARDPIGDLYPTLQGA